MVIRDPLRLLFAIRWNVTNDMIWLAAVRLLGFSASVQCFSAVSDLQAQAIGASNKFPVMIVTSTWQMWNQPKRNRLQHNSMRNLIAMAFVPSSFLLLVVRPGAPSSVLAPSSKARSS